MHPPNFVGIEIKGQFETQKYNFSIHTLHYGNELMTKDPVSHIGVAKLKQRGWTESLIKRFLGQHNLHIQQPLSANLSGERLYIFSLTSTRPQISRG